MRVKYGCKVTKCFLDMQTSVILFAIFSCRFLLIFCFYINFVTVLERNYKDG